MFNSINRVLAANKARLEKNEEGFTLIELLVVVLIIGVLSAIAIPIFLGQQSAARDSAVQSDITNAKVAIVSFLVANPTAAFPTSVTSLPEFKPSASSNLTITGTSTAFCIEGWPSGNGTTATATHFAASDVSGTVRGTCSTAGVLVPGT